MNELGPAWRRWIPPEVVGAGSAPDPSALVRCWPADRPLAALRSGGGGPDRRWSLLVEPAGLRVVPRGGLGPDPLESLRHLLEPPAPPAADEEGRARRELVGDEAGKGDSAVCPPPFGRGWIAVLAYELGRSFEPAVARPAGPLGDPAPPSRSADDRAWPDVALARVEDAAAYDHDSGRWWMRGAAAAARAAASAHAARDSAANPPAVRFGPVTGSSLETAAHARAVAEIVEAIASGEIFQANLTRRHTRGFSGSTRALLELAVTAAEPRYGALVELPGGRAVVSMSPELFVAVDAATRTVRSQPIKGTRAATGTGDVARRIAADLADSAKDAAELAMIVDLVRHDLGRIAAPGTVRVSRPPHVESHATVHHGVAEVAATLRTGADLVDVLAAAFPPGSITGAPKIRAMQVIDRHEPVSRGPYCGAIGWIGDAGDAALNVAIRTIAIHGDRPTGRWDRIDGRADYSAGGGIVADSEPAAEVAEADVKTQVFDRVVAAAERLESAATATNPSVAATTTDSSPSTASVAAD